MNSEIPNLFDHSLNPFSVLAFSNFGFPHFHFADGFPRLLRPRLLLPRRRRFSSFCLRGSAPLADCLKDPRRASTMILNGNAVHKSHYDILGVEEDANYEDIRAVYRTAILSFHPDKLHSTSDSSPSKRERENKFLEIQKAWEILSDQRSRTIYDNELRSLRQDVATSEDIGLDDLKIEAADDVLELSYPCMCGDCYVIDSLDLADIGCPLARDGRKIFIETSKDLPASVVLPCGSCSLKVRLLINPNTRLQLDDTHF